METHRELFNRAATELNRAAARGAQITSAIEAGQAEMPLTESFQRLAQPLAHAPITAVLVGLDAESASVALSHLLGQDYHVCKVVVPGRIGYTEVTLQERGFSVERGGRHREFDDLGDFLRALKEDDIVQSGAERNWMDPLRLKLASKQQRRGLRLLVPEGLRSLRETSALLSALADQALWLFVAGPAAAEVAEADLVLLRMLKERVAGCQPVFVDIVPEGAPPTPVASGSWAAKLGGGAQPPIVLTTTEPPVNPPDYLQPLTAEESDLRKALLESSRRGQIESALTLLIDELGRQANSLRAKRRLMSAGLVSRPDDDQKFRAVSEEVRQRLQDDFESLRRKLEEQSRVTLLNDGPAYKALREAVESISEADLEHAELDAAIRLTLRETRTEALRAALTQSGYNHLMESLRMIHEALENTFSEVDARVDEISGVKCHLQIEHPDQKKLWDAAVVLAKPELRYRGEIPRPTIMHRINEARQPLMLLMMSVMIFGGLASILGGEHGKATLQKYVSYAFLPVFLLGLGWTFVAFKRERHHLLGKELERLRDGVFQELKRVISDILREEQGQLTQFLQQIARNASQQVTQHLQSVEQQRRRSTENQRQQATDKTRGLDERLRQMDGQRGECESIIRGLERIRTDLAQQVTDLLRSPPSPKIL